MTMTTAALLDRAHDGVVSNDDPAAKPTRRRFSAAYKLAVLEEYDRTTDPRAKGALLRREGLYSSHIVDWRRAREVGALAELTPKVRRSKRSAQDRELERLRRANANLEEQLQRHRKALEIQGKASELLSRLLAESAEETGQQPDGRKP
jgi:transposase-like protein